MVSFIVLGSHIHDGLISYVSKDIVTAPLRSTQFNVLNDPLSSEHIKMVASFLSIRSVFLLVLVEVHSHGRINCGDDDVGRT
jgi:hypothetical protein